MNRPAVDDEMSVSQDDEQSYYDDYDNEEEEEEEEEVEEDEQLEDVFEVLKVTESPYRIALLKNMEEANARESLKKANQISVAKRTQESFCKPTFVLESVKQKGREMNNLFWRGQVDIHEDEEGFNDLVHSAVDNKSSNVLVRMRGNKLTPKQAEVKLLRIASKI